METNFDAENAEKFVCELCDFKCSKQSNYDKHIKTRKHLWKQNCDCMETQKNADKFYDCLCGKKYKTRTGLWKHKKCCGFLEEKSDILNQEDQHFVKLLMEENKILKSFMIEQNTEFKNMILDVCKQIQPVSSIVNSVQNNNNNSHNKTFNLQVFLNETCKDAMNIMDFVDSLQIQLSDLENVGKNGFVAGISDIILKNLRALDITERPIHCSDQKREIVYIKDDNQWHKEHPENAKLKKAIKYIAHKNTCLIKECKAKYPDCGQAA
jgi:hypothetical protein